MEQSYPTERWPAGHRAALLVVVRMAASGDANATGLSRGFDYAATGLQHLLRALADLGVPATTAWDEGTLTTSPQLARLALEDGHDIVPADSAAPTINLIARLTGSAPSGAALPESDEAGDFAWVIAERGGDLPMTEAAGMVTIPSSPFWNDAAWFAPDHPAPPSALLETWSQGLQSVRTNGTLMTVILHPHLSGRPGFVEAIARFLDEAIGAGDVWIARGSDLAEWWSSSRVPRTVDQ
jgi:peptidoglycan/xylan/chitin deacetylase (PgdA/CDA1 family)